MRITTLCVLMRCVCVLHILYGLVYNVSAFEKRILHGEVADPAEFKFLVYLHYDDPDANWQCSGSVISHHKILTVAHCLYQRECTQIKISPSTWKLGDEPTCYATRCYIHEMYDNRDYHDDIALVHTGANLLAHQQIRAIALPVPGTIYEVGTPARIAGWGQIESKVYPNKLIHATVRVSDWYMCNDRYKNIGPCIQLPCPIPKQAFCTMGEIQIPSVGCIGDSGGPVIISGKLAGLMSAIIITKDGICRTSTPALHTKVADYIPWIRKCVES